MPGQTGESNPEVSAKSKKTRWGKSPIPLKKLVLYALSTIPVMTVLAFLLATKVINPLLAHVGSPSARTSDSIPRSRQPEGSVPIHGYEKEGHMCELGAILVNPLTPGSRRIMKVNIFLEVASRSLIQNVEKAKPKLKHQIIMLLSSRDLDAVATPEGKSAFQKELKDTFASELGLAPGELRQVYFDEFVVQ